MQKRIQPIVKQATSVFNQFAYLLGACLVAPFVGLFFAGQKIIRTVNNA